jgi:hypothetical protein
MIDNRPGLSCIDYRIGTYSHIREWIIRRLNENDVLQNWTHRESDDPGIALLEGAAVLGDILTFYQELYANEAYLRTARWRESIADLVRLLGYLLAPGLGGIATFAFAVEGDDPVVIPVGFPIKSQVEGLEDIAEFENLAEVTAYPALSNFSLYRPFVKPTIEIGTSNFSIDTEKLNNANIELMEGDLLMLVEDPGSPNTKNQVVVVDKINEFFDRTEIHIEGSWQGGSVGSSIHAYKLGRSFRHYGYNAPTQEVSIQETKDIDFSRNIYEGFTIYKVSSTNVEGTPALIARSFPLDSEVDDLSVGSTILVTLRLQASSGSTTGTEQFFERNINKITKGTCKVGVISGGTTIIELNKTVDNNNLPYTDIRSVELKEVIGNSFSLEGVYAQASVSDLSTLFFFGKSKEYEKLDGRSLLCTKKDGTYEKVVSTIDQNKLTPDNKNIFLPLKISGFSNKFNISDFPLRKDPIVCVYGNLVDADQGKTEQETVLGNGDSRQKFQTFKLPKSPLTYHNFAGISPPEVPELQIYVDNRLWKQVPVFFGHKQDEAIYIVREDAEGDSWVQFGNGKTGRRLPSGLKNVVAKYRTGVGAYGALVKDTTVQAGDQLKRLDEIYMPIPSSGGDDPESGENARQAAPGKIQSLDRLVSLQDFESETLAIAGVSKVLAKWALVDGVASVVITVLMKSGREKENEQVRKSLEKFNRCRGADRFPIQVISGQFLYVYVAAQVAYDPTFRQELVEIAIKEALGITGKKEKGVDRSDDGLFALKNRRFGGNEYATRIEGVIQNVDGVICTKATSLFALCKPDGSSIDITTNAVCGTQKPTDLTIPVNRPLNQTLFCDNHHVLSLYKDHLELVAMSGPIVEGC